jgi:sporadic carbohydrate cluster 2OG-Fe(II) oxygenase
MLAKARLPDEASFLPADEAAFIDSFLRKGYAIVDLVETERLDGVRERLYARALQLLGLKGASRPRLEEFFDHTERFVPLERLNALRLGLIDMLAADTTLRPSLYRMARRPIDWAVGNEIAMQRAANLSIQLPGDDSSLLPLHSDVWSGNSPYELVLWVPLVDCRRTKSMYLLERTKSEKILRDFARYKDFDAESLYRRIEPELTWLEVPYGKAALFTHSVLHGNRVNEEKTTRWTFNVRLKSLLTPYGAKELGESFLPVTVRPATRIGFESPSLER